MSIISMQQKFHHSGKWILGAVTVAMLIVSFTGLGSILGHQGSQTPASNAPTASTVVAKVNGQPITERDYQTAYDQAKEQAQMFGGSQGPLLAGESRMQALQQVVNAALMEQVALASGVTVTDADINSERDKQLGQIKTMLSLPANATTDQVNVALSQHGASLDTILPPADLRQQAILDKYQTMLKQRYVATDAAVTEYFRSVHTRHILISNKTRPDAQAKLLAQTLIGKIKAGGDFAALAKEYSDDPGTKNKGGDDGWITQTTPYVPEFLQAAMTLQKGQVTPQPVLTQYGYFAIQAVDVKENMPKDYAKSQDKYRSQVAQYLQEQAEQQAMQTATQNAKIVVKDPLLRAYRKLSEPNPALAGKVNPSTVADFQAALKTADYTTQAEINAQLALLYRQEKQLGQEIAALEAANSHAEDPQLRLMLGDAYRTSGQTDKALAQYQLASQDAYNDPNIHMQLQQAYKQMGKTADYTKEATWMADYAKRQKQNGGANGMPAGLNIQPSGGGGGNSPS